MDNLKKEVCFISKISSFFGTAKLLLTIPKSVIIMLIVFFFALFIVDLLEDYECLKLLKWAESPKSSVVQRTTN
ncbi:hypothetical protein [Flavobacterium sp.]|uniref:hypothetical protein n=1 Tax=Flavobacterium sp. TaxID=239 RepID=UPI003D0B556D